MATSPRTSIEQRRPDLADALVPFNLRANQAGFVGLRLFPILEVGLQAGTYPVLQIKDLLQKRIDDTRASDGTYNRTNGKFGKDSYATDEHGMEERVDEREAKVWGEWFDAELLAAQRARNMVLQNHEARCVALAVAATNTTSIGTVWTNASSATPITDVMTAKKKVRARCGLIPNVMCIEWSVFCDLQMNAQMIDRLGSNGIRPTDPAEITAAQMAVAFQLDELIVSGGLENTANEAKDAVLSTLWDKSKAFLCVRSQSKDMREPRFGNTFHWGEDGDTAFGQALESYYDPTRRSDIVRDRMDTDEKTVYDACGELLTGITA